MEKITICLFLSFFLSCLDALCQDERLFRKIMTGGKKKKQVDLGKKTVWKASSPFYEINLDKDPAKESLRVEKKDGEDWLSIFNLHKKKIFSLKLNSRGKSSRPFRVSLRDISSTVRVLIVYYYKGFTDYIDFEGSGQFYFLTWENNDLKTLSGYRGPPFWHEFEKRNSFYQRRHYKLSLFDLDGDGKKEILVKHGPISKIYFYQRRGKWMKY